jgi:hypothetical protein
LAISITNQINSRCKRSESGRKLIPPRWGCAITSACSHTHILRKIKVIATNNSRKAGWRLLVRMRA